MSNHRLSSGIQVGILAGATTAGTLVGLGIRHAAAAAPFEILGRAFTARFAGVLLGSPAAMAIGVVIHFMWMMLWGLCFALFAARLRGLSLAAASALFAGLVGTIAATVAPGAIGAGTMASLTVPQTVFFLALLALSFAIGMRFARIDA